MQDMELLPCRIRRDSSRVVDVPSIVDVVELRRPDVAAPAAGGVGPDGLLVPRLQALERRCASDFEVCPSCCHEVVVSAGVDHVRIRSICVFERIGVGRRVDDSSKSQKALANHTCN